MELYQKDGITVQVINPVDGDFYKRNGYKKVEPVTNPAKEKNTGGQGKKDKEPEKEGEE